MKTLCLYHSVDLDGWMSAAIVKHHFLSTNPIGTYTIGDLDNDTVEGVVNLEVLENNTINSLTFKGYTYGDKVPDVSNYHRIIMCDMALLKGVMEQLHEDHTKEIIWLDHHYSAIHDSELPLKYNDLEGIRDTKYSACELTWWYYFPEIKMPEIVRLLGRYDCFGHKGTNEEIQVLEFQYGARNAINNYNTAYDYLQYCLEDDKNEVEISDHVITVLYISGKVIYEYLCQEAKALYNNGIDIQLETTTVNGTRVPDITGMVHYKFKLINRERFNPINFGIDYHKDGYDGCACFWRTPKGWSFSLYNDNGKVDCSNIAKYFGGGGHKGAAGFIFKDGEHIDTFINSRRI